MSIVISNDELELVDSGWFQSTGGGDVRCRIENLTVIFRFIAAPESEQRKPVILRTEIDANSNTLTLVFEGQLPVVPLAFSTKVPMNVGMVNGKPVFFLSFSVSSSRANDRDVSLTYSIYKAHSLKNAAAGGV
jgi:hypothetical protein